MMVSGHPREVVSPLWVFVLLLKTHLRRATKRMRNPRLSRCMSPKRLVIGSTSSIPRRHLSPPSSSTVRLWFTQAGGCAPISVLVLLPRRLVPVGVHPEEEARGGHQMGELGMDSNMEEQVLQCHQGDL
jgi:hypothetical protein